jgi:CHAT domain-containing protein
MLHHVNKQLTEFITVMKSLGSNLERYLDQDTKEIYFVTGRSFANIPLHLITLEDNSYIIDRYPVCYVNNLTVLSLLSNQTIKESKEQRALIASVSKTGDKDDYLKNNATCLQSIYENLQTLNFQVDVLFESDASKQSVISNLETTDEAIFLCHGFAGREEDGGGICLSYKQTNPPGINDAIVLKNFL